MACDLPFINRIPNQLNCPDYDALLLPFFFRQDTISDNHPFSYRRVQSLFESYRSQPNSNFNAIDALLAGIGKAPWFAYFVPKNRFKSFKYQTPLNQDDTARSASSKIVQIVVEVDVEQLEKNIV